MRTTTKTAILFFGLLLPATIAAQTCPGDIDHDGTVTVDELVAAVSSALHSCQPMPNPTATFGPNACPLRFDVSTSGQKPCIFIYVDGNIPHETCGGTYWTWYSDGQHIVLHTADPNASRILYLFATVRTGSAADLIGWSHDDPDASNASPVSGSVTVSKGYTLKFNLGSRLAYDDESSCTFSMMTNEYVGRADGGPEN